MDPGVGKVEYRTGRARLTGNPCVFEGRTYSIKNVKSVIRVLMFGNELKWSGDGDWLVDRKWTRGMSPVRGYFSDQKLSK